LRHDFGFEERSETRERVAKSMAVAEIDVGSQSTKVVVLEGDRILAAVTSALLVLRRATDHPSRGNDVSEESHR
jgi:activator of 2-hydroxyglutaryl-CoA dehydratase